MDNKRCRDENCQSSKITGTRYIELFAAHAGLNRHRYIEIRARVICIAWATDGHICMIMRI